MKFNEVINTINVLLSKKDLFIVGGLLFMSLIMAFLEILGIGGIIPFISMAQSPEYINNVPFLVNVKNILGINDINSFIYLMGFLLIILFVSKAFLNIGLLYLQNRFAYEKQVDLSTKLFKSYLFSDYLFHVNNNSTVLLKNVVMETSNIMFLIKHVLTIATEAITLLALMLLLITINYKMAMAIAIIFSAIYLITIRVSGKNIQKLGYIREKINKEIYQHTDQALSAIKDIKIANLEDVFIKHFQKIYFPIVNLSSRYFLYQNSPPFIIQSLAFCGVVAFVMMGIYLSKNSTNIAALILAYWMAGSRMLPSLNKIIGSYMEMRFFTVSMNIVASQIKNTENILVNINRSANGEMDEFNRAIELENVSFKYSDDDKTILNAVNIKIDCKQKVIIAGPSGIGKSTLMDLIVGLLRASSGRVLYDEVDIKNISKKSLAGLISYIPQNVMLLDSDIVHNIAFGIKDDKINYERINYALKVARLDEFADNLERNVGESGVKLSGGQRQRIGIARAIYRNSQIIVLDEVTSALDKTTEHAIIKDIVDIFRDKTIIMITHKMALVQYFDKICLINDKKCVLKDRDEYLSEVNN